MSSQICLKWNSFLNNIATSFESLWEEEGLVDVTLASDGQCLTAHKVILSASSPFFKKVFQTNPCQHPVIILQDVHFSELEALLIFIYKGEVNIDQKKLPALLKAAETLQIRGLSGSDVFARDHCTKLEDMEQSLVERVSQCSSEEPPKRKKSKVSRGGESILESVLTPRIVRSSSASEMSGSEKSVKEAELPDNVQNPMYDSLEMKIEPFEVTMEELQKEEPEDTTDPAKFDSEHSNGAQGTSAKPSVTVIAGASVKNVRLDKRYNCDEEVSLDTRIISETSEKIKLNSVNQQSTDSNPGLSHSSDFSSFTTTENTDCTDNSQMVKGTAVYPPFPCPFCDRAYTSWGFRRRHIKAVHTATPELNCKWCPQVLPNHAAWRRHVISRHNLSAVDAHNGLLILEEAHMVLQIAHPTKLDTLVNIIKQSSQQSASSDQRPD